MCIIKIHRQVSICILQGGALSGCRSFAKLEKQETKRFYARSSKLCRCPFRGDTISYDFPLMVALSNENPRR
jgi:hypothetical protein